MRKIAVQATITFSAYVHDNDLIDADLVAAYAIEQMGGGNEVPISSDHGGGYVSWDDAQLQEVRATVRHP